ncbi:SDR family NAD(P)-dependent oxidoreductase [Actinomycetospora sp. CA-053990]|uniref:SDR family NAD(P)-dependent oxidoreductase n=1 Tax=Actinomycetospora sp. CA-053990 TaxID=3239891 RepID=UPI003D8CB37A
MHQSIVITGASSGFGAMSARALARAGHTVYAGIRDTAGRNAPAVADAAAFAAEQGADLRTVELDVADQGSVDAAIDGAEVVNAVGDRVRTEFYRRIGLDDLLHVRA